MSELGKIAGNDRASEILRDAGCQVPSNFFLKKYSDSI